MTNFMMRHYLNFFMIFCLLLLPCYAQQEAKVTLQFLTFPITREPLSIKLLVGENKTLDLNISSNELAQPIKVPHMESLSFGDTHSDKDDKEYFKVYGKAKTLPVPSQLILLIRKGKRAEDGFDVIPFSNDIKSLGGGKFLFYNLSIVDIAGEVGGKRFTLKPSQHTILDPKPDKSGRMFHALFYFREGNNPRAFFSSMWPYLDKGRSLVFFYNDSKTNKIKLHTIRDFSL